MVTLQWESTKEILVTWAKVDSVPTSIPLGKEVVSVSVPQEKVPLAQVNLPVVALHEVKPAPYSCDELAYDVFSKGKDVEVPAVLNVVDPMARVPLVREIFVSVSTISASANSSKLRELEVTPRPEKREPPILNWETLAVPDTSKLVVIEAPLVKDQIPDTDSFWERDAGPPVPQSSLTMASGLPPDMLK